MVLPVASFFVTFVGVYWLRKRAVAVGLMDVPNDRSSHSVPTPRGGGLAFVLTICAMTIFLASFSDLPATFAIALVPFGLAVATVGYIDDWRGLSAGVRLAVHVVAAAGALCALGGWRMDEWSNYEIATAVIQAGVLIGVVWMINLFNFMDGTDGLASSEALFICLALAFLLTSTGPVWHALLWCFAAACSGFLLWNWPPARIFMGDVGSGFLGFALAIVAIVLDDAGLLSVWTFVILSSAFVADASVTLLRRVVRGERWYQAHRSHAYQQLATRFGGHLPVVLLLWVTNAFVVLPVAYLSHAKRELAPVLAAGLIVSLSFACLLAGAGRRTASSMY